MFYSISSTDPRFSTGFKKRNTPQQTGMPLPSSQKVPSLCFYPWAHESVFLSMSEPGTYAAGRRVHWHGDAGEAEGVPNPHASPAPSSLAEMHSFTSPPFQGPENHWSYLTLLLLIPKEGKEHWAPLGHIKQRALHGGAFKAPLAPQQGEATTQNALFLLPKLRPFIYIPLRKYSGPNWKGNKSKIANIRGVREHSVTGSMVLFPQARPASPVAQGRRSHFHRVKATNRLCPSQTGLPRP